MTENINTTDSTIGDTTLAVGSFAGYDVLRVKPETFKNFHFGKRPFARWKRLMDEDSETEIIDYCKKNQHKGIILQDSSSGAMVYLRRP